MHLGALFAMAAGQPSTAKERIRFATTSLSILLSALACVATVAVAVVAVSAWQCANTPDARCNHGILMAAYGYGLPPVLLASTVLWLPAFRRRLKLMRVAMLLNAAAWAIFGVYWLLVLIVF